MDIAPQQSVPGSRSKEDIALDLLRFMAGHANLGRSGATTPGFGAASTPKSDDAVTQLFDLYARCRAAVEAPAASLPGAHGDTATR